MANKTKKAEQSAKLYWIFTAFMLLTATPIGIVMIIFKLMETKKQGKPQIDYDTPVGAKTTAGTRAQAGSRQADVLSPMQKKADHRIKVGGGLTALFGLIFAICVGDGLLYLPSQPMWFLEEIWFPLCAAVSSGVYLGTGLNLRKKVRRFRNYLSMIGRRRTIPVSALASAANRSANQVREDLETMLDEGILTEGFLDYNSDRLILSSDGLQEESPVRAEPAKTAPTPDEQENALLDEIRCVNDLVKNEKLSAQIDQLFLGQTMDITSDVEVLERMLAKDGLSGQGITLNL